MKRIVLTHSYFLNFDPKQKKLGQPYAPLATLYAAAVMRQQQYDVSVCDVMFATSPEVVMPFLNPSPDYFVIYDDGFNYLTKMCLTNMRDAAFEMIQLAKQKGCTVIVSSSDATDHYEQYLEKGADFILLGESEQTLRELTHALDAGNIDLSGIPGIAYKKESHFIKTQKRPVLRELDSLPFPAWDLIDIEPYRRTWMKSTGYFSLNMGTTRGCPFSCNWCAKPIYGNRYNARSPKNVVDELVMLKQRYDFDHIWFCDDIFGLKPGWVAEFARLVQEHQIHFKFKIQSRADLLLQEQYVAALASAGCQNVWMGAESGSQKILDAMDKGITVAQIKEATTLLKAHGIEPSFFIQFGYLGEQKEDIHLTIDMINKLMPSEIGISVSYPLPGTVFYEKVKQDLKQKTNWTDSNEMALMFHNTYQPKYYKRLHSYVHKNYRMHKALDKCKRLIKDPATINYLQLKKALSLVYYIPAAAIEKIKLKRLEKAV